MVEMKLFFAFNKHPHSLLSLTQCGKQRNVWGLCGKEKQRETERGRKRGREIGRETHRNTDRKEISLFQVGSSGFY